jgi:hypothetical protein
MSQLQLPQTIETARINELPLFSVYGPLADNDHFVAWLSAFNKTVKIPAQTLYNYFNGGGGGSIPPVVLGNIILHVVTTGEAGGTQVNIPTIAGQNFFLERDGQPMLVSEYNILNAGGFELATAGDTLIEGQRFKLSLYNLAAGSPGTPAGTPLIKGEVTVSSNQAFDVVNHVNKLIQFRPGGLLITYTLPLVDDLPDNTIIPMEASITTTSEIIIATQGGQNIYINNSSKTSISMRSGEVLWLYRADDGYYIINDFARIYRELCKPHAAYKIGDNEMLCDGTLLNRTDYPRLWEAVQSMGASLVSESLWQTAAVYKQGGTFTTSQPSVGSGDYITIPKPYRGCFSLGDGSTTFRIPDLMNTFLRGLKNNGGSDTERYLNKAGGIQEDMVGPHTHPGPEPKSDVDRGALNSIYSVDSTGKGAVNSGIETRPLNAGMLWIIKI